MTKRQRGNYTDEVVKDIYQKLMEAKEKPVEKRIYTKKEAIEKLKKPIFEMQKKGYSFDDIKSILAQNGMEVSISSLKSYLGTKKSGEKKAENDEKITIKKQETANTNSTSKVAGLKVEKQNSVETPSTHETKKLSDLEKLYES